MKKYILLIALFLSFSNLSISQTTTSQLLKKALSEAYNMNIDSAEKILKRVIRRTPRLPDGYFQLAQINFWCFLGSRDVNRFNQFIKYADITQNLIDSILNKNNKNIKFTYMAGKLASYRAMINALNNSTVDALWYSKKSIDYYEKTLQLNPKYYDAYFGLGLFDYAMSFVPDFLKWAVNLAGLSSNKNRGLDYIKIAYRKGFFDKTEIEYHLAKIYSDYIAAYDSSYFILKKLIAQYPNNTLFRYQYAVTLIKDKKLNDANRILNTIINLDNKHFPQITSLAHFRKGEIYFKKNNFKKAINHFKIFLETTRETDLKGLAALNIAISYKLLDNEKEFNNYLKRVKEGNQDLFEDAYAKEKSEYFLEHGISSYDIFLLRMKNNIDAGSYKLAYDSLKSKIDSLHYGNKKLGLAYLSEVSLYLGKLQEAIDYAQKVISFNNKEERWVIPFSNYIIAKANYFLNKKAEAKEYLKLAEENNDYEFRDYIQSLIENLKRKLNRKYLFK